jgi:hypothetical protein
VAADRGLLRVALAAVGQSPALAALDNPFDHPLTDLPRRCLWVRPRDPN